MDRVELITILKDPAYAVMRELKIPSSIIIAISVATLEQEDIINIAEDLVLENNPMAIEPDYAYDGETVLNEITKKVYRVYETMEEGLANFITSNNDIFEEMKGILQYTYALKKNATYTEDEKKYLISIIDEHELYKLDQQASDVFFSTKPMVELSTLDYLEKSNDLKKSMGIAVRDSDDNNTNILEALSAITKEKKERVQLKPLKVKKLNESMECKTIDGGTKVFLLNANLYETAVSTVPKRSITGDFYTYSGVYENNRYAIMRHHTHNGANPVIGYVDRKHIIIKDVCNTKLE